MRCDRRLKFTSLFIRKLCVCIARFSLQGFLCVFAYIFVSHTKWKNRNFFFFFFCVYICSAACDAVRNHFGHICCSAVAIADADADAVCCIQWSVAPSTGKCVLNQFKLYACTIRIYGIWDMAHVHIYINLYKYTPPISLVSANEIRTTLLIGQRRHSTCVCAYI